MFGETNILKLVRTPLVSIAALLTVSASAQDVVQREGVWAQTYVGRPADPTVTFGQLPNGMRYAIRHNNTPPGQMAVRLLIGSGSLAEPDDQQGIAHFIEHMAFRGSTHVADGELARILQRQGLALGPDTNASTTQEATVYQFDFPKSDTASLDSALMMMRETASELTFSQTAVDAERGVVLSEERERDTPPYRAQKALLAFALDGQLAPKRWPIGAIDVIAHAQPTLLKAFYAANYRPDNATLVVVGDVDTVAVEAQIKAKFGDWKAVGPKPVFDFGRVMARGEKVRMFNAPGSPQLVQLAWARPFDATADTERREHRNVIRLIATQIINHRLQELAQQPSPPFIGAGFGRANTLKSVELTTLVVATAPDKWQAGLAAVVAEQRRIVRDGVTDVELAQAEARLTAYITNEAAHQDTRTSPTIANAIVKSAHENSLFTSAAQDHAEYLVDLKTIATADINAALRAAFTGAGPLIFASSSQPIAGGDAAVRLAFDTANTQALGAGRAASTAAWPYTSFGPAGAVVDRKEIADLGVTVVRFANGNTLTVKPTTFAKDEVLVDVEFGHGRVGLPKGIEHAYWLVGGAVPTFIQGGTAKLSLTEITNLLASKIGTAGLQTTDTAFFLDGKTRPQDIDTELQLLTAYLTDPGFRPEAVERMIAGFTSALPQIEATPAAVLQRDEQRLLHDGDPRWVVIPRAADLSASRTEDVKTLLQHELATGPVNITIVGDITIDAAVKATAQTLGAISRRESVPSATAGAHFPAIPIAPIVLTHVGRIDQAIVVEAWPTTGFERHETDSRAMTVATQIIRTRLFDRLRAADGATYSPAAESDFSSDFRDYGVATVRVALSPEKIAVFATQVRAIIDDLATKTVSEDELTRAKQPLVERRLRDLQANLYWLNALADSVRNPADIKTIRDRVSAMQAVSVADIRRVCSIYFAAKPLEIVVRASGITSSSKSP